jgi:protein-disulfide isomerase
MAKKINRKTPRKTAVASSVKRTSTKVDKVDVVAEAQKELRKLETNYQSSTSAPASGGFAWGVFIGAIILTAAVFLIGGWVKEQYNVSKIERQLPSILEPLAGGMAIAEIGKPKDVSGVYQFTLKFSDYDTEFTSSITKDGKLFFVEAIEVAELLQENAAAGQDTTAAAAASCESVTKTDNPVLTAYVSSDCSHCKNAEKAMTSAITQVPDLASKITLRYAGTIDSSGAIISFLGSDTAGQENLRQACIQAEQHDVFWPYVACMSDGGTTESCSATAKVNLNQVNACMADDSRGLAIIKADIDAANAHSISGTPSFFLNDEQSVSDVDFGGRVADSYKQIVCCGSNTPADFCATTLTE